MPQELRFGGRLQGGGIAQGHRRGGVSEIALHHMDRDAVVEQLGGPGVAQPVGLGEPQRVAGGVGETVDVVEPIEDPAVGVIAAWSLALVLVAHPEEQVLRLQIRVTPPDPVLLFADHVDHGLLDQNGGHHPSTLVCW